MTPRTHHLISNFTRDGLMAIAATACRRSNRTGQATTVIAKPVPGASIKINILEVQVKPTEPPAK